MPNDNELKPCPFCGDDDIRCIWDDPRSDPWQIIYCAYCFVEMRGQTVKEVISKWNTRSKEASDE